MYHIKAGRGYLRKNYPVVASSPKKAAESVKLYGSAGDTLQVVEDGEVVAQFLICVDGNKGIASTCLVEQDINTEKGWEAKLILLYGGK